MRPHRVSEVLYLHGVSQMRQHEDIRTIVIEKDGGAGLGAFILGAVLGAGVALLLAPRTGEETQDEIRQRAQKFRATAEDRIREAQEALEARLEEVREGVVDRVEAVREAVETGKGAAQEARGELEEKLERSKAAYRAGVEAARKVSDEGEEAEES